MTTETFYEEVRIPEGKIFLDGDLTVPAYATAIIIFSHGSGSSRFSKRNRSVAKKLNEKNFGTLLFDLLTEDEDADYYNRFNIDLLSKRLISITQWLEQQAVASHCRFGYFGASTGAASALQAAAHLSNIMAVVCRGGRPDLAMNHLPQVNAPTLFIVGSLDKEVIELNKKAMKVLTCPKELSIVEGASHLFEEPGKMDTVSALALSWFEKYLQPTFTIN